MATEAQIEAALVVLEDRFGVLGVTHGTMAAALAAADAVAWRPMETAPTQMGVEVLLFIPPFSPMQGVRRSDGSWMVGARAIIGRSAPGEPTRWQPLPAEPFPAGDER